MIDDVIFGLKQMMNENGELHLDPIQADKLIKFLELTNDTLAQYKEAVAMFKERLGYEK